jgi:preprotein translocase subunit SecA
VADNKFGVKLAPNELKKMGREAMPEFLLAEAEKKIQSIELSDGARFLEKQYGIEELAGWMKSQFIVVMAVDELLDKDNRDLAVTLKAKLREAYRAKDASFPVQVGLMAHLPEKSLPGRQPNRTKLLEWAQHRFAGMDLPEDLFRTEPRSVVKEKLLEASAKLMPAADFAEIDAHLDEVFSGATLSEAGDASELVTWAQTALKVELDPSKLTGVDRKHARDTMLNAYDLKYRPEMHSMERRLLLDQLDSAWKSHLLSMDHLRSSVGLAGYGQEDPKIVYKREGMKIFDLMWDGVHERVAEMAFRVEDVDEEQVSNAYFAGAMAVHEQAQSAMRAQAAQARAQEQASTNSGEAPKKIETIRNTGAKVGRNDPCHCGSGKKYKNCHMKLEQVK